MSHVASRPGRLTTPARVSFSERRPAGIAFTERMVGYWSPGPSGAAVPEEFTRADYERAFRDGEAVGRSLALLITIVADNLDDMLAEPHHQARFAGTATFVSAPPGAAEQLLVTDGIFRLFVDEPNQIVSKKMEYIATLTAVDGRRWKFEGFKGIRHGSSTAAFVTDDGAAIRATSEVWSDAWRDQTRLFFRLTGERDGSASGLGILTLSLPDFLRQLRSVRAPGAVAIPERYDTVMRFATFYGGVLRDTYGGPFARSRYAPPNWWNRRRRVLQGTNGPLERSEYRFRTDDDVELLLTRYRSDPDGTKRPVILAPGFGVRADSFAIDTVDQNIVEALCRARYDVWLFDYRASPELDASRESFSIDDIALHDWPAAIDTVRREATTKTVDVIAHCIGSMSFLMSALAGRLTEWIGSAICSQVGVYLTGSRLNHLKALSGLGYWLELVFGLKALRVTVHAADTYRRPLADRVLKFYPTDDPCDNPVCRRVRFVFGESYLHANLNRGTHDAVIEMFGDPRQHRPAYASLRALRHLSRMLGAGEIRGENGESVYLGERNLRHLDFRLALMSGRKNHIFLPSGIDETYTWLNDAGQAGKTPSLRELAFLPFAAYAHMDCFIGVKAHQDVFPALRDWLDADRSRAGSR